MKVFIPVDYSTAQNKPLIVNKVPVGIVKEYNENGLVTCLLWDKYISIQGRQDGENKAIIDAVVID